jgi:hypothetical protein
MQIWKETLGLRVCGAVAVRVVRPNSFNFERDAQEGRGPLGIVPIILVVSMLLSRTMKISRVGNVLNWYGWSQDDKRLQRNASYKGARLLQVTITFGFSRTAHCSISLCCAAPCVLVFNSTKRIIY